VLFYRQIVEMRRGRRMLTPRLPGEQKIKPGAKSQLGHRKLPTASKALGQPVGIEIMVAGFSQRISRTKIMVCIQRRLQATAIKLGPNIGDGFDN